MFKKSLVLFSIFSSIIFMSCGKTLNTPVITAEAGNGSITISWEDVPGAQAYNVVYQEGSVLTADATVSTNPITSPFELKNLNNGSEYTVAIKALGSDSESELSLPVSLTPKALIVTGPSGLTLTSTNSLGEVSLSWSKVEGIDGYNLYWEEGEVATSDNFTGQQLGITDITYIGLAFLAESYTFFLTTYISENGVSVESGTTSRLVVYMPSPVADPTLVLESVSDSRVTLNWNTVNGAVSYNLYYKENNGIPVTKADSRVSNVTSSYTIESLTKDQQYRFAIATVDGSGAEKLSDQQVVATPTKSYVITTGPIFIQVIPGIETVTLQWMIHDKAQGYELYYNSGTVFDEGLAAKKTLTSIEAGVDAPLSYTFDPIAGGDYVFAVKATNSESPNAPFSDVKAATIVSQESPAVPSGLNAVSSGANEVSVTFDKVVAADFYTVYYVLGDVASIDPEDLATLSTRFSATTDSIQNIVVNSLTSDQIYSFAVQSENSLNNTPNDKSALSDLVKATPVVPTGDPTVPVLLNATGGHLQIVITYTDTGANNEEFDIYYAPTLTASTAEGLKTNNVKITVAKDTSPTTIVGLSNEIQYSIVIFAKNGVGDVSSASNVTEATPVSANKPGTPYILNTTSQGKDSSASVAFVDSDDDVNISNFIIYYAPTATVDVMDGDGNVDAVVLKAAAIAAEPDWSKVISNSGVDDSPQLVTGLTNDVEYAFVMETQNVADGLYSELSNTITLTPQAVLLPPDQPAFFLNAGDQEITIIWTPDTSADSYNIYWQEGASIATLSSATKISQATGVSTHTVSSLVNDTTYSFIVTAVNSAGESVSTTQKTAAPEKIQPPYLFSEAGNGLVTVSWLPVIGADHYLVYYKAGTTVAKGDNPSVSIPQATATTITFDVTPLTNGTAYTFAVIAVDAATGGIESDLSNMVTDTPNVVLTGGPVEVRVTPSVNGYYSVDWDAVADAESYEIFVAEGTADITTGISQFAAATATGTTVNVYVEAPGTHKIAVRAVNSTGNSSLTNSVASVLDPAAGEVSVQFSTKIITTYTSLSPTEMRSIKVQVFTESGIFNIKSVKGDGSTILFLTPMTLDNAQGDTDATHFLPATYFAQATLYKSAAGIITDKTSNKLSVSVNGKLSLLVDEDATGNITIALN